MDDCTVIAFSFLSVREAAKNLTVCKRFRALAEKICQSQLRTKTKATLSTLWDFMHFRRHALNENVNYTTILDQMPNLKELDLNCFSLSTPTEALDKENLEAILNSNSLSRLTHLSISIEFREQDVSNEHLIRIAKDCRRLVAFTFHRFKPSRRKEGSGRKKDLVTDKGMCFFSDHKLLQRISLHGCGLITDSTLAAFGKIPKLNYLHITGCGITNIGISDLLYATSNREFEIHDKKAPEPDPTET